MAKTMTYHLMSDIALIVHSAKPPTDAEWEEYLKFISTFSRKVSRSLVLTPGAGPNAIQRARMNEVLKSRGQVRVKIAVVTNATMVRGIVTALSWFNPDIKTFPLDKVHEALTYLDAKPDEVGRILIELRKMQAEVAD